MGHNNKVVKLKKEYDMKIRYVTKIKRGEFTDFVELSHEPYKIGERIKKINRNEYLDKSTGEVKQYNKSNSRIMSKQSLYRTVQRVYDAVLCNCSPEHLDRLSFVTLTFADDIEDYKIASKEFDKFSKRFKRYVEKNLKSYTYDYICILEPQVRKTWHFHVLMIWGKKAPFISNDIIEKIWKNGYTKITSVNCKQKDTVENLAEYLTAHICNLDIVDYENLMQRKASVDELEEIWWLDEDGGYGKRDNRVKDGRISLYPQNVKIVRTTQGIKRPKKEKISVENLKKEKEKAGTLQYSKMSAILPENKLAQEYETEEECVADAVQLVKKSHYKKKKVKRPIHDISYASLQKDYNNRHKSSKLELLKPQEKQENEDNNDYDGYYDNVALSENEELCPLYSDEEDILLHEEMRSGWCHDYNYNNSDKMNTTVVSNSDNTLVPNSYSDNNNPINDITSFEDICELFKASNKATHFPVETNTSTNKKTVAEIIQEKSLTNLSKKEAMRIMFENENINADDIMLTEEEEEILTELMLENCHEPTQLPKIKSDGIDGGVPKGFKGFSRHR